MLLLLTALMGMSLLYDMASAAQQQKHALTWTWADLRALRAAGDLQQEDQPLVLQTARLFVRNLPYAATAPELTEVFQEHGELSEVHIIHDK